LVAVLVFICNCYHECNSFLPHPNPHYLHHNTQLSSTITKQSNLTKPSANVSLELDGEQLTACFGQAYAQKILELAAYKSEHGDCMVPKRYKENPSLGNFVNKQRQLHRKFLEGEKCSITQVGTRIQFHFSPLFVHTPLWSRCARCSTWKRKAIIHFLFILTSTCIQNQNHNRNE
jgi:hypothetical protein